MDPSKEPTPLTKDEVCDRLLEFIGEQTPKKDLPSARLKEFYNSFGDDATQVEDIISKCNHTGHLQGIRSFCGTFPTKLAYRKVFDKLDKASILILRMCDLAGSETQSDRVNRMACKLAMSYNSTGRDSSKHALRIIEEELAELKLELGSMNKLAKEVKERGICLRDGSEHGVKLRSALRSHRALPVDKEMAKRFPHAKKCLITV